MTKTAEQYELEWKEKVGSSTDNIYDLIDPLMVMPGRPDNAVTLMELCKKYKAGKTRVNVMLQKLIAEGKVIKQRVGSHNYYVMVKEKVRE